MHRWLLLGLLVAPAAQAKKVRFTFVPVQGGSMVVHTQRERLELGGDSLGFGAQTDHRSVTFYIPRDDEDLRMEWADTSREFTDANTGVTHETPHPLSGLSFTVLAGDELLIQPEAGLYTDMVVSALRHMVSLVDFGSALDGQRLTVGRALGAPVLAGGGIGAFLGAAEGDELRLLLTGVRKVEGKKLAVFEVHHQAPEQEAPGTGEVVVDPKTARVVSVRMTSPMDLASAGLPVEGVGVFLLEEDASYVDSD